LETVVWRGGVRFVLPAVPGLTGTRVAAINDQGWVAGTAGFPHTTTHAVVWKPTASGYEVVDLGTLPGTTASEAVGIDNLGRVVGWSTTLSFPPTGSPFVWTEAGGLVDLSAQGFPDETPLAVSPGGTVATPGSWYRLDDPASVVAMPPSPPGFFPAGAGPAAVNDAGDQARFLTSTSAQNLVYLFRFHHEGTWQQLWPLGTGHLATYGVGSITADGDVTATAVGTGLVAAGPSGLAQPLTPLVSPSYGGGPVTVGGPMTDAGAILAQMLIGQSSRLVRLVPTAPCTANCIRVARLRISGTAPAVCNQGIVRVTATLTVTDEAGNPLAGVRVSGHFLDDYWLDRAVSRRTDAQGRVTFNHKGPPCVGAVAFLVTDAATPGRTLDRTAGQLANSVIPRS
jgi:hypothetical protein